MTPGRLFIFGGEPGRADPLDPLRQLRAAPDGNVTAVGPQGDIGTRAFLRRFDPARDAVLYDVTDPRRQLDLEAFARSPGGVLTTPETANAASILSLGASVISLDGHRSSGLARVAVERLDRPSPDMSCWRNTGIEFDFAIFGAEAALYAAAMAVRAQAEAPATLIFVAPGHVEADIVERRLKRIGLLSGVNIAVAPTRADVATCVHRAAAVIDLGWPPAPGLSDAAFAARSLGRAVHALTGRLEALPALVQDAIRETPPYSAEAADLSAKEFLAQRDPNYVTRRIAEAAFHISRRLRRAAA